MPDEPPRLFLSYGVRDASELAERLHRDLTARHYQIWQDIRRIRIGWPWDEEVQAGLRNSQVVLALLSPQSVRRAMDAGNPTTTDSVCLDEIAYARGSCKIPIVPVQVVSCEAPFLIYRLHQIDFRRWRESEVAYQAGLNQICTGIEAALRGETPERPLLEPWDFAPFLLEKRNHFTGRKWLFRDLDEWRRRDAPPALLITGEPGIGKSAIVAALVNENPEGQVLAYHCCQADTPTTLEPARFVRSLAGMLAARLEGYAAMLDDPGIKDALERADTDPASAFEAAILSPLHSVPKTAENRRYLLIDALEEALAHPKRPTIVDVFGARLRRLPPWLGIVATARNEPGVLSQLRGLPTLTLEANDPKNQDDVRVFLQRRLSEPGLRAQAEASGKTLEELATGLLRSSAYNFLFVATALDAVERGQFRFDEIERLPPGLSGLYEVFFDQLFPEAGVDFQTTRHVLEVLAAAREPLTRLEIAAVTGMDAEKDLPPLLRRVAAFVPVRGGRYSLFHRSLFDWLTGWDVQQDQPLTESYGISLKEGRVHFADWGWADYGRGVQKVSPYGFRHLVAHLHEAGRDEQARTVLLDYDWLQTKLEVTDANALIADYDYLAGEEGLRLIQSAIRLSSHVLARDARQLAGQLTGRLLGNRSPNIETLLKQTAKQKAWAWLQPSYPSLILAGGPLIRTLEGHTGPVFALAVTPDGHRALSGSGDGTLRLWDLESGQTLRTFEGHSDPVFALAIIDRHFALSGSGDRTLRLWDLESGQTLRTLKGHTSWVTALAVTADGRRALSGSRERTLRLWDLESGQTLRTLEGHKDEVRVVAVMADGRRALSGSDDHTLRLWDLESGQTLRKLEGHTSWVTALAVTADERRALSGSDDHTLRLWDLESGQSLRTFEGHTSWVTVVESGQTLRTLESHIGAVNAVAVIANGRRALSGSGDHTLRLWDLERESGQAFRTLERHIDAVNALTLTADGLRILSSSRDYSLRLWDLESGQTLRTLKGHADRVRALTVTVDGHLALSSSWDETLRLWDLKSGRILRTFKGDVRWITLLKMTADGRRALSNSLLGTLWLWDLESGQILRTLEDHTHQVSAVAVAPDGRRAVSGSSDGTLRVWDLESGKTQRTLEGHTRRVNAVAMMPDGRHAVSASNDHTLRLWNLESGQTLRTLKGHTGPVNAVAVTADSQCAVSSAWDETLRLWDLEGGRTVATFTGEGEMTGCAVTPDGHTIVASEISGRVHSLRLVEADETKPARGDAKIQLLLHAEQARSATDS